MSANGAVSTTVDFTYFGGGYVQVSGEVSGLIDTSFVFDGVAPISGEIQPVTIDFGFSAGIETPTVYGTADVSFDFASYSFVEFGVQRYLSVANNILFDYTANSSGYVTTHANFNPTLDFTLDTNLYIFSLGDGSGTFSFDIESLGYNISTRQYSKTGGNYVSFDGVDKNAANVINPINGIKLLNNGISKAEILQT
jgi:hypothetical protein